MKAYIVTATDTRGRRDTFARESTSLEHVRMMLEREGYADIEFHDDEVTARLRAQSRKLSTRAECEAEVNLRRDSGRSAFWKRAIRQNLWFFLISLLVMLYGIVRMRVGLVALPVLMLGWWLWQIHKAWARVDLYQSLVRASARADLAGMESLIAAIRANHSMIQQEQLRIDLLFREAAVNARKGDIGRGLEIVAPVKEMPVYGHGLYEARVSSLYAIAGDIPQWLAMSEAAYEKSGRGQTEALDLSFAHARVGEIGRSTEVLAQVDRRNLTALHAAICSATEGILHLRAGDANDAVSSLALASSAYSAVKNQVATWPFQGIIAGYYALSLARAGRCDDARTILAPWREIAMAHLDAATRHSIESEVPN